MNRAEFWRIIDDARRTADGDGEATGEAVQAILTRHAPENIRSFAAHLGDCLTRSYTAAMSEACSLMTGYAGDDLFECFRAWLVTRGERVFETCTADPDQLSRLRIDDPVSECSAESLLAAPDAAFELVTGAADSSLIDLDVTREPLNPPAQEPAQSRFPKLWRRYGDA